MNVITNVILTASVDEDEAVKELSELISKYHWSGRQFVNANDHIDVVVAGNKAMECTVLLGAFNYLQINELLTAIKAAKWKFPEIVQLFFQTQDADTFSEWPGVRVSWCADN